MGPTELLDRVEALPAAKENDLLPTTSSPPPPFHGKGRPPAGAWADAGPANQSVAASVATLMPRRVASCMIVTCE
ncbi:MAG: hypothetical protein U0797_29960 [Gemmataceae bacterium]